MRGLSEQIRTKRSQWESTIVTEYRRWHFYHRPTWDIERQAQGEVGEDEEYADPAIEPSIPERARLAEILCHQPGDWTDKETFRH